MTNILFDLTGTAQHTGRATSGRGTRAKTIKAEALAFITFLVARYSEQSGDKAYGAVVDITSKVIDQKLGKLMGVNFIRDAAASYRGLMTGLNTKFLPLYGIHWGFSFSVEEGTVLYISFTDDNVINKVMYKSSQANREAFVNWSKEYLHAYSTYTELESQIVEAEESGDVEVVEDLRGQLEGFLFPILDKDAVRPEAIKQ